jgi:calcium/calmodulin-dependent protein kinase I
MGRGNYNLYYLMVSKNMLYVYEEPLSTLPLEVIFIEGCYVEKLDDYSSSGKYGLKLSHHSDTFKEIQLYMDTQSGRDVLFKDLKRRAKSKSIEEFFTLQQKVGYGKFSEVFRAVDKTTFERVAVKVVDKRKLEPIEKEMLRTELVIMELVNHPNVIQLKDVIDSKTHIYIIMELIQGGELFDYIKKCVQIAEPIAAHIIKQLIEIA